MQLYDTHSHILPEFDDGSQSVEESLKMLNCLAGQDVTNVCLTPHFYSNKMSIDSFVEARAKAYKRFLPYKPLNINFVLGAEVYVTHYLFTSGDISKVTYGKSNYILTEFPYVSSFEGKSSDMIWELINNFGLVPVIPHVERYDALTDNPSKISELKKMGVIIQSNVENYADKAPFFTKHKMLKLVKNGYIDILGTDCHSMTRRSPEFFTQAMDCISSKCSYQILAKMIYNSKVIFDKSFEE